MAAGQDARPPVPTHFLLASPWLFHYEGLIMIFSPRTRVRPLLLWIATSLGWWACLSANDTTAYLASTSVRVLPATLSSLGLVNSLGLSSLGDGTINDELAFSDNETDPESHAAIAYLNLAGGGGDPIPFNLFMGVPDLGDVDLNGLTDFFEVRRSVSNESTTGELNYDDGSGSTLSGTVDTVWNRAAGSASGTVSLHLKIPDFGVDLTFLHRFEIIQYKGTLSYTNKPTGITASVQFLRLGLPSGQTNQITGPISLIRTNDYELGFTSGTWHYVGTAGRGALSFESSEDIATSVSRTPIHGGYEGLIPFDNGVPTIPSNGQGQYLLWWLDIFDSNDANHNGIPDLSDAPPGGSITPQLKLELADNQWNLTVTAAAGQTVTLYQATDLTNPIWKTNQTLTLTGLSQVIALPPPSGISSYFRAE